MVVFGSPAVRRTPRALLVATLGLAAVLVAGCTGNAPAETQPKQAADTSAAAAPKLPINFALTPADAAGNVAPGEPVTVVATNGTLGEVSLVNAEGKQVAGELAPDKTKWTSTEALGYDKKYTLTAAGKGTDGKDATAKSAFSTVKPGKQIAINVFNPKHGETVGVGMPLQFGFSSPPPDKKAAERAIQITTEPKAEGAFYWFSDKEVRWRPQHYWKPGTKIKVNAAIYGKSLGGNTFGMEDRKADVAVGDEFIAEADGKSHQMIIKVNGQVVKEMPISMGRPAFPSNNGTHVVTERHASKLMDSTTYGLSLDQGGYKTPVKWATRISNGGIFIHGAPWSVRDQGHRNVSHGCLNASLDNAKWFYDNAKKGDIVVVTNTGGPNLQPWDGFGDWQVPWEEWLKGGKK
ncbi:L,D-transpeptidase [Crossiella sp. NPDC003009]